MRILNVVQGSPEWLAARAQYNTASEAPAMMGVSKYMSRDELLRQKKTGVTQEVDGFKKALFAKGHATEATARVIVEEMIGELLSPITAVSDCGTKLASLDGATMVADVLYEHKLWAEALASQVRAKELEPHYYWQLEHELLVTGAEKVIFVTSDGTREKFASMEYFPVPGRAKQLIDGWKQFDADLAAYVPTEVIVPAVAAPQMNLPAVSITVNGQITLADNLDKFGVALTAYIEKLNRKPETDQDFANLEDAVKRLKAAEEQLDAAESSALGQTESIDSMRRTVALHRETARTTRILIDKLVKAEKENRRTKIISDAVAELHAHMKGLWVRTRNHMPTVSNQFQDVVKGLKSLDSMKDKVSTELARCKIEANAIADRIQFNLALLDDEVEFAFLFPDHGQIVLKAADDFKALVNSRISEHKAEAARKEQETRDRIRREEQERADKEAREKLEAEQRQAKQEEDALVYSLWANARRIEGDTVGYIQKAIGMFETAAVDWENDPRPRVAETVSAARVEMKAKLEAAQARESAAKQTAAVPVAQQGPAATVITHEASVSVMPASVRQAMAPKPDTAPTMTLGEISTRLGFNVTSAFLASLGFEATTVKASKLYQPEEFSAICDALIAHISEVSDQYSEVTA